MNKDNYTLGIEAEDLYNSQQEQKLNNYFDSLEEDF